MVRIQHLSFILGLLGSSLVLAHSELRPDQIIGNDDLTPISTSVENEAFVHAIGRMKLGCTATHVGNGIAISAGHCFASGPFEGVRNDIACDDAKHRITWGVTYNNPGYLTSKCVEVLASEYNEERDYTIFKVSPVPETHIDAAFDHKLSASDSISIFSHPRLRPLEWSQWCTVEGFLEKSLNNQFFYSCDTEGGSSGAAVLDKDFHIVGIHNFYNGQQDRNGATLISSTPLASILSQR